MSKTSEAQKLVDAVQSTFRHQQLNRRPVHTFGVSAEGQFKASRVAKDYCIAKHFNPAKFEKSRGFVPVTVRFSNGSGGIAQPDGWSDVRGMATRFHLDDDFEFGHEDKIATDLIAMTLGEFFSPTVDDFLAFSKHAQPTRITRQSLFSKLADMLKLKRPMPDPYPGQEYSSALGAMAYANRHRSSQMAVLNTALIGAPVSYARANYYAVHTFKITGPGPDKRQRYVRFQWQPIAGVRVVDIMVDQHGENYLKAELRDRLKYWPAQFRLLMTIGEMGDAIDDPTKRWPERRVRVVMGTLTLKGIHKDQDAYCEKMSFNPGRLVLGIEASEDPILVARKDAYEVSRKRRGGTACPFSTEN